MTTTERLMRYNKRTLAEMLMGAKAQFDHCQQQLQASHAQRGTRRANRTSQTRENAPA